MTWLIKQDIFDQMQAAMASGRMPSALDQATYEAEQSNYAADLPRGMSVAGNTAAISITGVLTNAPDLFARWFGGGNTVYSDIAQAAVIADNDPNITSVEFDIDSPGGQASAEWFAVMTTIANMSTPTRATVRGLAASAAYGIAAQADSIVAVNAMAAVGSIGVVATFRANDGTIEVTSTNAPNKRPDPKTEAGVATIRAQLDQIEAEFIGAVGRGRKKNYEDVKSEFGQGAVFLAAQALERGMIDSISSSTPGTTTTANAQASGEPQTGASKMDLDKLRAEHPALYAQVLALGVVDGQALEKARVEAHLTLGEASGATDVSIADIKSGAGLTPTVTAAHTAATLAAMKLAAATADEGTTAAALGNIAGSNTHVTPDSEQDFGAEIADELELQMGIVGDENA
jgi:ClpP class serine protease